MKVIVAHNRYRSAMPSGENVVVDAEIEMLAAAGVEVIPYIRSSDEIPQMSARAKLSLPVSTLYSATAVKDVRSLIHRHRPDLLHLHNPYPLISPAVIRAAHRLGVPVVQTVHNHRHVCAASTYFRDGKVCTDCKGLWFPYPAVKHACYRDSRAQSMVMAANLTANRRTLQSADCYIALTSYIAEFLYGYGIPPQRVRIKPNTVDAPATPPPLGTAIAFVGRLSAEKGILLLRDAWELVPEGSIGTLLVAGDGPLKDVVAESIGRRSDVEVLGQQDANGVARVLERARLVVVPSTCPEAFPRVLVEALAMGRPALVTDVGGLPTLIDDRSGWRVTTTPRALADGLMTAAREVGPEAGQAARSLYDARYSKAATLATQLQIYAEVAGER